MSPRSRLHAWLHSTTFLSIGLIALAAGSATAQAQVNWTGVTSDDWFTAGNWDPATVPSAGDAVVIDTTMPSAARVAGSATSALGALTIGDAGTGTLTIGAGGTVSATSVTIARQAGSTGTLNIGGSGSPDAPGTIDAATVTFGAGTGTVNFNHTDTGGSYVFASQVSGNGTVNVQAGTTLFTADNTYTGTTTISDGAQLALGDGVSAGGAVAGNIVLSGPAASLAFNRPDTMTIGGTISGAGFVTQFGSGTTILTGSNTYTGNTQIFAGTLVAGTSSALGTGLVFIVGGATLGYADGVTITNQIATSLGGPIILDVASGTATQAGTITPILGGSFVKTGAGTLVLTTDSPFPFAITISDGRLQLGDGGTTGSLFGSYDNNGILAFNHSGTFTFVGAITGNGVVEQNGPGTTVLTGTHTYSGGTVLNAGTLSVSEDGNLGDISGGLTFNGGTLQNTAAITTTRTVTLNAGGGTFQTDADLELDGDISGSGGLTKTGAATLILTGNNTYDGPTTITAGILLAATSTALSPLSAVTVNAGGALQIIDGGIFASAGSLSGDGLVVIGMGSVLVVGLNDQSTTFSGAIHGNGSFEKEGAGTLTLTGASSIGGVLSVCCGRLDISGGSFTAGLTDVAFGTLAITSGGRLQTGDLLNSATLLITGPGSIATASGDTVIGAFNQATATISSGGRLESLGDAFIGMDSTITVTGTGSAWTIAGGLGIGDPFGGPGTLTVADGAVVTVTTITIIDPTGTLNLGDGGLAGAIAAPLIINDGRIVANFTDTLMLAAPIGGSGSLTKAGTGTLILTGDNTYTGGTTITAGRLQLGNGGTTGAIAGDVVDNGILAFNRSDTVTFAGLISGSGSVEHNGPGTTVLTGANTYAGGTVLNAGTLSVAADTNLGAGGSLTFNGGTLQNTAAFTTARNVALNAGGGTFQTDADLTVDGTISGAGGLTKTGAATLILTGSNTYAGTTTITAGTLQVGNGGTTGAIAGNVVNNATLAFNRSDTLIVAGAISGTGAVRQNGTGTTVLTGAGTYGGGTTINAGTLQLGNGGTTGSIGGDVLNNGTLAFNRADTLTFAGIISGTGAVQQNGAGTTVLTGTSTYGGLTSVNAGRLIVNGAIASTVTVSSGGVLGGGGTVGGFIANAGGTVSPGNSPGTLNVAGNVAFAAGSTYLVEIDAANNADRIVATGTATLGGGTVQVDRTGGGYTAGARYTILTASGGVNGRFSTLATASSALPLLDLALSYDPANVYLDITRNAVTFCGVAATRNQCAAGSGAESLGAGNPIFDAVVNLPDAASIRRAFDLLSGEIHASAASTMVEQSHHLRDAVIGRVRQSYGTPGPAAALAPEGKVMALAGMPPGAGPDATPAEAAARLFTQAPAASTAGDTVVAAWTQGIGAWGKRSGDGNAGTLSRSLGGFLIGVDATIEQTWRVGLAAGYTRASFDVDSRASSGNSDNYHVALYGGGQLGALGLRAGASFSWHDIATTRRVAFAGIGDRLKADYGARTAQVFGEAGYALALERVALEPFAGLAWVSYRSDRIDESGGAAALSGRRQAFDMGFSTLGLRAAATVTAPSDTTAVTLRGTLGWRHAFGDVTPEQRLAFRAGGSPFTVVGVPIARDSLIVEAGIDIDVTRYARFGIAYSGQFAGSAQDHAVKGSLSLRF